MVSTFEYACTKTQYCNKKVMISHTLNHAVFVTRRFVFVPRNARIIPFVLCALSKALASFALVLPCRSQDVVRMAVTLIPNL